MSVRIIVDSTTDMTPQVASRVRVVPLTIHFGDKQYVSGVDIDANKFYEMLVESDTLPTTSQPTPLAFAEVFQEAVDAGAKGTFRHAEPPPERNCFGGGFVFTGRL